MRHHRDAVADGGDQRTAHSIVVGRIVKAFFCRFYAYHVGINLRGQVADNGMHVVRETVIHHQGPGVGATGGKHYCHNQKKFCFHCLIV